MQRNNPRRRSRRRNVSRTIRSFQLTKGLSSRRRPLRLETLEPRRLLSTWAEDEFSGPTIDPGKWSIVDEDESYCSGSVIQDGAGHLKVELTNTWSSAIAREYVATAGTMTDEPWVYYSSASFFASVPDRSDVDLGYRFEMAGGGYAYLEFDSTDGMRLKYGDDGADNNGPLLYPSQWYELKFAWDGSELRGWYRERGRAEWLGGSAGEGFLLCSSITTHPATLKIGQADTNSTSSSNAVTMTLLVDYWSQTEPVPDPETLLEEPFEATVLDPEHWTLQDFDFQYSSGLVRTDGFGHLETTVSSTWNTPLAQAYAGMLPRLPTTAWTAYSAARFSSSVPDRGDVDLGYRFEMTDGDYAYLEFDGVEGMRLKYGSPGDAHNGPYLCPTQWYELKFAWDGADLRGWYREQGRSEWLGGDSEEGYLLYSSTTAHPDRLKIGQTDIRDISSSNAVAATLLVDYWKLAEPDPVPEGATLDAFDQTVLDATQWQLQEVSYQYGPASVGADLQGNLRASVSTTWLTQAPEAYAETVPRLPDQPWTAYTTAHFTATAAGRTDLDLGYHFSLSDGKDAWLEFDSKNGTRLKYGSTNDGQTAGPTLVAAQWYDLKFTWDGSQLRAFCREAGETEWLGDWLLVESTTTHPERVKIGQSDIRDISSTNAVTMTLLVGDWRTELASDVTAPWVVKHLPSGEVVGSVGRVDVTFSETIDAATLDAGDVAITGPAGSIEVTGITRVGARRWWVEFPRQTTPGAYHVSLGPAIADPAGVTMAAAYDADFQIADAAASWPEDEFPGEDVNSANWTTVDEDETYSSGSVGVDGSGHLQIELVNTWSATLTRQYVASTGTMPDQPWVYYTAANFTATAPERADVDVGYYFAMADGRRAWLEFDSVDGMRLKYGNQVVEHTEAALHPTQWYELKFAWDGTELLAWYRERGRQEWLGGPDNGGLRLYWSTSTHPSGLKIGQADEGQSIGSSSINATLLVDYWGQTEPAPAASGTTDDSFDGTTPDAGRWQLQQVDYQYSTASIGTDGSGHLQATASTSWSSRLAEGYAETISRLPAGAWTAFTAASFSASVPGRSDVDLGYRFEMSDGTHAFLEFDSADGMQMKYGNQVGAFVEASLHPTQWYELKFAWDGQQLRAWYRERGRSEWLGGTSQQGLLLYSSTSTHPERVKIGQSDLIYVSNSNSVSMTLLVDYWQLAEPAPAAEALFDDPFQLTVLDGALWQTQHVGYQYSDASIHTNGFGQLDVRVSSTWQTQLGEAYVETLPRLPAGSWTVYTAANFQASALDRSDVDLGYRFEMADGGYAYLEFDSPGGMRLKYGSDLAGETAGPSLFQTQWYEIKFAWDGAELRAWYRERGRSEWLGGTAGEGYLLYSSATTHPERVKIGQADVTGINSSNAVSMTLLVDYWQQAEPGAMPQGASADTFGATVLDPSQWQVLDNDFQYSTASVQTDGFGHLKATVAATWYSLLGQGCAEMISRMPGEPWSAYTTAQFTATAAGRADVDLGYRFELSDGQFAYLEFDSTGGTRLKYGNGASGETAGPTLVPGAWYELRFTWDGSQLRASYREAGQPFWEGDYLLIESTTSHPERVKIGQSDISSIGSTSAVTMTLLVDSWQTELGADSTLPWIMEHSPAGQMAGAVHHVDVTFSETIDPASLDSGDVSIFGPGGAVDVTAVQRVGGRRYRIEFGGQTGPGTYYVQIGPGISDPAGNLMAAVYDAAFEIVASASAWAEDEFTGAGVDPEKWTTVDEDESYSTGSVTQDGSGCLAIQVGNTWSSTLARAYVVSTGAMPDNPWAYHTSINYTPTAPERSDVDLGYRFEMADGNFAYLEFDSVDGMRLKYGNQVVAYDGPALHPGQWYELKYAWDGTELRAWWRESGREEWLGGPDNCGYLLYASTTTHPEVLKIGQAEEGQSTSSAAFTATLLVDDWSHAEPAPAAVAITEDGFDGATLDPALWRHQDVDYTYSQASADVDGSGLLATAISSSWTSQLAEGYVETLARLPEDAWTAYAGICFEADVLDRSDLDLGFRFEMSDGTYAYYQVDGVDGARMKYGNQVVEYEAPRLHPTQWYEFKFDWNGTELRAWGRHQGRTRWLGGYGGEGFLLYSSTSVYPERVKIGQSDIGPNAASAQGGAGLWIDYWQADEPLPAEVNLVNDEFDSSPLDPALWLVQDVDFIYSSTSVEVQSGVLEISLSSTWSTLLAHGYVETFPRLPSDAWTAYTSLRFPDLPADREDLHMVVRFEMSDGGCAYVNFDGVGGLRLKYASSIIGETAGPVLPATGQWLPLKFTWDGTQLRTAYWDDQASDWAGDHVLIENAAAHPERVKIGQPDLVRTTTQADTMTMEVEYWRTEGEVILGPYVVSHEPTGVQNRPVSYVDLTFNEPVVLATSDVSLTGPGGPVGLTGVEHLAGATYRVHFPDQRAQGAYLVAVGPNVRNLGGDLMNQDRDENLGEDPDDVYQGSFTLDVPPPGPRVVTVSPDPSSSLTDVTQIEITFDCDLDPATVVDANFELLASGGDGTFDGTGDTVIAGSVTYDAALDQAIFVPEAAHLPLPPDVYKLTIFDAVQDPQGNALDGEFPDGGTPADLPSGDTVRGGDFVAAFEVVVPSPVDLTGFWALVGIDTAGTTWRCDMELVQEASYDGLHLSGHFDWDTAAHGSFGYGREYFEGTLDPDAGTFHVEGTRLENSEQIILGFYDASVSQDGRLLYGGQWSGIGGIPSNDWTAVICDAPASTFDADLEGWQLVGDGELVWQATGGDPGGQARALDDAVGGEVNLVSPPEFHGNWLRAAEVPAMISVDYFLSASGGSRYRGPGFVITGPGGAATLELPTSAGPSTAHWQTLVVPLDESVWIVTSGTWEALLADVSHFEISAEYFNGDEEVGVDNVRLLLPLSMSGGFPVISTFDTDLEGWTLEGDGTAAWDSGNGDPPGCFRATDPASGPNSDAIAPPAFLGDWSALDANGVLAFAQRILSGSANNEGIEVHLSGPGGSARYDLDAAEGPYPDRWTNYMIPLREEVWNVTSGTWPTLLEDVQRLAIDMEFVAGTEVTGLDNVYLGPPMSAPVVTEVSPIPLKIITAVPSGVSVGFDQPMDASTITAATFQLQASGRDASFVDGNEVLVSGQVTYNQNDYVATFVPDHPLRPDAYRVIVSDSVLGSNGLALDGEFDEPLAEAGGHPLWGSTGRFPSGDGTAGGAFNCRFDLVSLADATWSIGEPNNSSSEFDTDPHDDPRVIDYTVGDPFSTFPGGFGGLGERRLAVNIYFQSGVLESGGDLIVGWSPHGTPAPGGTEQYRAVLDGHWEGDQLVGGQWLGDSEEVSGRGVPYFWFTSLFQVPPLSQGSHVITLEYLMGDGMGLDFLAFQPYSEGLIYAAAQGGTVLVSIPPDLPYEPTYIGHMDVSMFDIALSPGGQLYGATPYALYRIDPTDGQSFYVGGFYHGGVNALDFAPDGTLYAATWNGALLEIDPATGASTRLASLPQGRGSGGDVAYQVEGTYAGKLLFTDTAGQLGWIDPSDGTGGMIGPTGYHCVYGLDNLGETLFAFGNSFQGAHLLGVNPATGQGEPLHTFTDLGFVYGIACRVGETINVAPTAEPQSLSTPEDTPLAVTLTGTDPDGDPLAFQIRTAPRHGSLSGADDQWTYTPDPDFYGTDRFWFTAFDGNESSLPAEVTIEVTPLNDAPEANDSQVTVWLGESVEICLPARDVDDPTSALTCTIVDQPTKGTLGPVTGRCVTYTALQTGVDFFTWYADDGHATDHQSATATVSVTVLELPDLEPVDGSLIAPAQAKIGEQIHVEWTVINNGPGTPGRKAVRDAIYLSDDAVLDAGDRRLHAGNRRYVNWLDPGQTYTGSAYAKIPRDALNGPQYLIVSVDNADIQPETDEDNNTLAVPIEILPSIELIDPFIGQFVDPVHPVTVEWADVNTAYSAEISIAIDTDDDPQNGEGHQFLVTGLPEDSEGPGDRAEVTLSGVAPGHYYVWAVMSDQSGHDEYSQSVPIRVFDHAAVSIGAEDPATAGNYGVLGVEAGLLDDQLWFRVRTNYGSARVGTDIYLNVGGDFRDGTGTLFGIPIVDHAAGYGGPPVAAGALYADATFLGGSVRHRFPVKINTWNDEIYNVSMIAEGHPEHGTWSTEVVGAVDLDAIGACPGTTVQIGWGPRCANAYDDVVIDIPGQDLAVVEVLYRPDEGITGGIHESREPGRPAVWQVTVGNHGTEPVTEPWTLDWILRSDATSAGAESYVLVSEVHHEDVQPGQALTFTRSATVPAIADPQTGAFFQFGAVVTPPPPDARVSNNQKFHEDPLWIQEVEEDDYEQNDSAGDALDMGVFPKGSRIVKGTVDASGDGDWYRFELDHKGEARDKVTAHFEGQQGNVDLYLYRADAPGVRVRASEGVKRNTEEISLKDLATGDYLVEVAGAYDDVSPAYRLEISGLEQHYITGSNPSPPGGPLSYVDVYFNTPIREDSFNWDDDEADVLLFLPNGDSLPPAQGNVTRRDDTTYRISFPPQTQPGIYSLYVGPYIENLAGQNMNQDLDERSGEPIQDRYQADIVRGSVQKGIQIDLVSVTDTAGCELRVFRPNETVRMNFELTNMTGSQQEVICSLRLRGPDNATWTYDTHSTGQDVVASLDAAHPLSISFDWEIPPLTTPGLYDVLASARSGADWNEVLDTTAPGPNSGWGPDATVYDQFFVDAYQWSYDHADEYIGLDRVFASTRLRGYGQTVAVVDTGINYNWVEMGGGFGEGYRVVNGYDFVDGDPFPMDTYGHGTACAEIVGGTNPAFPGIAPASRLVALRVTADTAAPWPTRVADALDWIIEHHDDDPQWPITVVNMSFGTLPIPFYTEGKLRQLEELGITLVAAAGNKYMINQVTWPLTWINFPAISDHTIAVGAVNSRPHFTKIWDDAYYATDIDAMRDEMLSFSDRRAPGLGPTLNLVAPGGELRVANGINPFSGTSAAAPCVSGAAVITREAMMSENPRREPDQLEILQALQNSGTPRIWDMSDNPLYELTHHAPALFDHDNVINSFGRYYRLDLAGTIERIKGVSLGSDEVLVQGQIAYESSQQAAASMPIYEALAYATQDLPIRLASLELISSTRGTVAQGYTDHQGRYSISLGELFPQSGETFHIRVYADSAVGSIRADGGMTPFYFDLPALPELTPGVNQYYGTIPSGGDDDATAFALLDSLTEGYLWLRAVTDYSRPEALDVTWPADGSAGFDPTSGQAVFSTEQTLDRTTHLHEYALAVLYDIRGGNMPQGWWDGQWHDSNNPWLQTDPNFAFTEGWADFFTCAVMGSPLAVDGFNFETNRYWMGQDARDHGTDQDGSSGQIVEGAVTSILWDVFDGPAHDDDGIGAAVPDRFWLIWNVLTNTEGGVEYPENIDDFYLRWRQFADQGWTAYSDTLPALERILAGHGITQIGTHAFDDEFDTGANDNDTMASSAVVSGFTGGEWSYAGLVSADDDWYRLDLPAGTIYPVTVRAAFNHDQGNLDLQLIWDDGSVQISERIAEASQPDSSPQFEEEQLVFVPEAGKTYYVRVYGFGRNCVWGEDRYGEGYYPDFSPWYDLHVSIGNTEPAAAQTPVDVLEDGSVEVTLNVIDDGPLDLVSCYVTSLPEHGTLFDGPTVLEAGTGLPYLIGGQPGHRTIRYEPDPNYHGSDGFTFRVTDGQAWSAEAEVQISVLPVNDPPTAHDDVAPDVDEDHPITFDVLSNDEDIDGDTLNVGDADFFSTLGARVTVNADGTLTFDPRPSVELQALADGEPATDDFTYLAADGNGGSDTATVTITVVGVNDPPHVVSMQLDPPAFGENHLATLTIDFTDPESLDEHTLEIDWGDGSTEPVDVPVGERSISRTHRYLDDDPSGTPQDQYVIHATITDGDGLAHIAQTSFTLHNLPPQITALDVAPAISEENGALTLTGSFTDVGTLDTHTVEVDWGDGTSSAATVDPPTRTFTAEHSYLDDDPSGTPSDDYTITVTLEDDDTGSDTATTTVTVSNVAPELSDLSATPVDENGTSTLSGNVTDPGTLDTFTLTVDWGDGSPAEAFAYPAGTATFSETHQYLDDDPSGTPSDDYTITVTVEDDDTATDTETTEVTVSNVAPELSDLSATPVGESGTSTLSGSITDPGMLDTLTLTVDWGDGSLVETFDYPAGTATFSETHQYLCDHASGTPSDDPTITVTVEDDDTGSDTETTSVAVCNVAAIQASVRDADAELPASNGEADAVPQSLEWIDEWDSFWVEIWGTTPYRDDYGIRCYSLDLLYDTDLFTATTIEYGPAFTEDRSGWMDDAAGRVHDLSAATAETTAGDDKPVLLARVFFEPAAADQGCPHNAEGQYITPVEDLGLAFQEAEVELAGVGRCPVGIGPSPETDVWPVIYDIDDDGCIGFGDLAYFAEAFQQKVDEPDTPFAYASDFDCSGRVDVGDLAFLAENFWRCRGDTIVYPGNFPDDWQNGTQQPAGLARSPAAELLSAARRASLNDSVLEAYCDPLEADGSGTRRSNDVPTDVYWLLAFDRVAPTSGSTDDTKDVAQTVDFLIAKGYW